MSVAIEFKAVSQTFGHVKALDRVSFSVHEGEFFSMLGPSGSGKTTCLRLMAGFEQPSSGSLRLLGSDALGAAPYERDVNTVFQDYALFPHMNVLDNVSYGLLVRKVNKAERHARAHEALAMVALHDHALRTPAQLSGGQRQRVALARALVNRPRILLLDEPLGALDMKLREQMQVELKQLHKKLGITFVYVTHDQGEALSMSDRIAVFNQGRIEQIANPRTLYHQPRTPFVADFVGSANVIDASFAKTLTGAAQAFAVRQENIQIHMSQASVAAGDWKLEGEVMAIQFLGANQRLDVKANGQIISALQSEGELASRLAADAVHGQRITLSWSPKHMVMLDA